MTVDFSSETMEVRRKRHTFFQVLKKKELSTQNFIASDNILRGRRESRHSQMKKHGADLSPADPPYRAPRKALRTESSSTGTAGRKNEQEGGMR